MASAHTSDAPALTVLMSVHDARSYLDEAVRSIVEQTFRDFEFLIIDDASTDGSRAVLEAWADRDARIHLLRHDENRGLGYSLARGVEQARAPWIARMDADDIAKPERLTRQMRYIETHPEVDVVGAWATDIDGDGRVLKERTCPVQHEDIVDLVWTIPLIHPTVLFRQDAIRRVGSYAASLRRRQDYDLWFRCVAGGLRFANIPESLLYYRFTEKYYHRNDWRVAWKQAKIGWRGCRLVEACLPAYVGVALPLVRALMPRPLEKLFHRLTERVDPRRVSVTPQG